MKTTNRILSLVLALVMLMSFSVTAFADTTTATIDYYIAGEYYYSVPASAGDSVMEALLSDSDAEAEFSPQFTDKYGKPAFALLSLMETTSEPVNGADYGVDAEAWSTTNAGYGLVSVERDSEGNITAYNYVYTGYDWMYSVKNASGADVDVSELYMNQYILQPGDVVKVDYNFQEVYWTATEPMLASYPYI